MDVRACLIGSAVALASFCAPAAVMGQTYPAGPGMAWLWAGQGFPLSQGVAIPAAHAVICTHYQPIQWVHGTAGDGQPAWFPAPTGDPLTGDDALAAAPIFFGRVMEGTILTRVELQQFGGVRGNFAYPNADEDTLDIVYGQHPDGGFGAMVGRLPGPAGSESGWLALQAGAGQFDAAGMLNAPIHLNLSDGQGTVGIYREPGILRLYIDDSKGIYSGAQSGNFGLPALRAPTYQPWLYMEFQLVEDTYSQWGSRGGGPGDLQDVVQAIDNLNYELTGISDPPLEGWLPAMHDLLDLILGDSDPLTPERGIEALNDAAAIQILRLQQIQSAVNQVVTALTEPASPEEPNTDQEQLVNDFVPMDYAEGQISESGSGIWSVPEIPDPPAEVGPSPYLSMQFDLSEFFSFFGIAAAPRVVAFEFDGSLYAPWRDSVALVVLAGHTIWCMGRVWSELRRY